MELNEIISNLSPINTKEKVDLLIAQLKMNNIQIDSKTSLAIRYAIQKMTMQLYFVRKYLKEQNKKPVKVENKPIEVENKPIEKDDNKISNFIKEITSKKKKKKEKNKAKAKNGKARAKAKVKEEEEKISPSVARILRTFGSDKYRDLKKKSGCRPRKKAKDGKKKAYPVQTENSIRPIYIASGGMNKRY